MKILARPMVACAGPGCGQAERPLAFRDSRRGAPGINLQPPHVQARQRVVGREGQSPAQSRSRGLEAGGAIIRGIAPASVNSTHAWPTSAST